MTKNSDALHRTCAPTFEFVPAPLLGDRDMYNYKWQLTIFCRANCRHRQTNERQNCVVAARRCGTHRSRKHDVRMACWDIEICRWHSTKVRKVKSRAAHKPRGTSHEGLETVVTWKSAVVIARPQREFLRIGVYATCLEGGFTNAYNQPTKPTPCSAASNHLAISWFPRGQLYSLFSPLVKRCITFIMIALSHFPTSGKSKQFVHRLKRRTLWTLVKYASENENKKEGELLSFNSHINLSLER